MDQFNANYYHNFLATSNGSPAFIVAFEKTDDKYENQGLLALARIVAGSHGAFDGIEAVDWGRAQLLRNTLFIPAYDGRAELSTLNGTL